MLNELETEERLEEMCAGESELVEDCDEEELEMDEETEEIMEYVFGFESDDDMSWLAAILQLISLNFTIGSVS